MKEETVVAIERLIDDWLDAKDIAKIMSNDLLKEALENGADFAVDDSVAEFGEANCDNDLYEGGDFESFGEFLLSTPGVWEYIKLPSGKVFSIIK